MGLDGRRGPFVAALYRIRQRFPVAQLLSNPLKNKNIRIHRHADRQNQTRDPRQRQSRIEIRESTQNQNSVRQQRDVRDHASDPVIENHKHDHQKQTDRRRLNAPLD